MSKKHMTQGGPGDKFLGDGKVDTSKWFQRTRNLEQEIKNGDIWFCSAPFQLLYTNTSGTLAPCSWAEDIHDRGPNVLAYGDKFEKRKTLKDYYLHDPTLNKIREEMTTVGSDLETCNYVCYNCRHQEEKYGRSRRQASMKIQTNDKILWPRIRNVAEEFLADGRVSLKDRIFEVQVKAFGNKCNLDCYMCIPFDSSVRMKTMGSEELKEENVFSDGMKKKIELPPTGSLDDVIDQITELAPYIYNLKLIGGEPLVMPKFYKLLEEIIKTGEAPHIMLKYQTNITTLAFDKHKIAEFIPEFELFEFTVSLDGIEKENDYIRRRSSWPNIVHNMQYVSMFPNVHVNINGTISFLSVLRFYRLIEWANDNGDIIKQINWSNIRGPKRICANVLPQKLKDKLIPMYEGYPDIQNVLKESNHGHSHQDALDYLMLFDNKYKGTKWEMNLFDVYPELEEFYNPPKEVKRDEDFVSDVENYDIQDVILHPKIQDAIKEQNESPELSNYIKEHDKILAENKNER